MIKRIAVIGSTGLIGLPVTQQLLKSGFEVKALVRDAAKARKILPAGVDCVQGDIKTPADIQNLLTGCHAAYLNLSVRQTEKPTEWHTETDGLKLILEACKKTGITRIGMISSLVQRYQGMNGFHWWAFDVKKQAIELIKASGIPYFIFYPSSFMENFKVNYKQGRFLLVAGTSEHKQYFIAAEDYSKQVARAFQLNPSGNREYIVQGLEGFTTEEACIEFKTHFPAQKLFIVKAPLGMLRFMGNFVQTLHYGAHIIEALNKYPEKFEAENTWEELGMPSLTLKGYARTF